MERDIDPPEPEVRAVCLTCLAACPDNVEPERLVAGECCDMCGLMRCHECDNVFDEKKEGHSVDGSLWCPECHTRLLNDC
jgi:hypothetical protein